MSDPTKVIAVNSQQLNDFRGSVYYIYEEFDQLSTHRHVEPFPAANKGEKFFTMKTVKDGTSCPVVQSPSLEVIKTQLSNLVWIQHCPVCEQEAGPGDAPNKVPSSLSEPGILLDPSCWQLLPGGLRSLIGLMSYLPAAADVTDMPWYPQLL